MALNNLPPPQAYTRDILALAYEWLRTQPQSVREMATNSDNLVALYFQSRRRPNSSPQVSEASTEAFKQDLKNLAEGLKQFEEPRQAQILPRRELDFETSPTIAAPLPVVSQPVQAQPVHSQPMPSHQVQSQPIHNHQSPHSHPVSAPQRTMPAVNPPMTDLIHTLDSRSLEMVRKVQQMCNLGSEREALRLIIAVGVDHVRGFFNRSST